MGLVKKHMELVHSADTPREKSIPRRPALSLIEGGLRVHFYLVVDKNGKVKAHRWSSPVSHRTDTSYRR